MASGIYVIENTITGDVYVGSSCNLEKRKRRHFLELKQGIHHSAYLQRAYNKYGLDAFVHRMVEEVPDKRQLLIREQAWLEQLKPAYNMNPLATNSLGMQVSEETKQRLLSYSLARTTEERRLEQLGKKRSEETKRKLSEKASLRTHSEESKLKMAEKKRETTHSEATRKRMSETHLAQWATRELTEEEHTKLSEAQLKVWANKTEEERQAFSEKARNRPPISEVTRRRMSEAAKNRGKRQSS